MTKSNLPDGVRLGVAPLSWTNDVLDDLGGDTPLETCLAEAAENGYAGIELGRKFPRDAGTLKPLLDVHGLTLASGWHSGFLTERDVADEMADVAPHAKLLSTLGVEVMVYGPVGTMAEGALDVPMSRRLTLDDDQAAKYADRLKAFDARLNAEYGLRMAYHHHLMMVLETFDEVCKVIDRAQCGLLVDTGHAYAGGFDYAKLFDRFGDLVRHVHLKDVRADRLEEVRAKDLSFNDAVRMGMFTVPGDGALDFMPVADFVRNSGYQGWLVVEAEQDPSRQEAEPKAATKRAYDHINSLF
ncbi:myo-inosose-2 dehydratase [Ruegeria sp. R13_0]|uniref:myo-inosose-2 dehydratase n=1 Tax=Ruegeria sp. R13_0 TaxID=2821099 RepID=UPI001ADA549E|nr:myo-inosose-2 dehydratase [Ruegeria sp. R13_0]MBO9436986.1 myo-inosose-2 dehydratase [Ruegeria sp. R13_0]